MTLAHRRSANGCQVVALLPLPEWRETRVKSYPPINEHGNGKSTFYVGNTSSNGPFPIAMLVYWVCKNKKLWLENTGLKKNSWPSSSSLSHPPTGYIILCWNTLLKSWTHGRQILPATSSHLINKTSPVPSLLLPRKITWVAETNRQLKNYKPSRFCFGRSRNPSSPKVKSIQPSCEPKNFIES